MYGVPVTLRDGEYSSSGAWRSTSSRASKMDFTLKELEEERAGVAALLALIAAASTDRNELAADPPAPRSAPPSPPSSRCRCSARSTPTTRCSPSAPASRRIYLSGGGVAAGSLGMPDLGISTLDDVLTDVRRITDVCTLPLLVDVDTGFGARVQHRAHGHVADQGRRRRRCTSKTRSAPSAAATGPARKSCRRRRWSTASRPRSTRAPIPSS